MTAVQRRDQLRKDAPDKRLLGILVLGSQVSDHSAQVAIATVLHVQVEVLGRFEMLAVIVADDVGVSQGRKDLELCMQLFTLFLGHLEIADLLATKDHAVVLPAHFSDDAKGAMA